MKHKNEDPPANWRFTKILIYKHYIELGIFFGGSKAVVEAKPLINSFIEQINNVRACNGYYDNCYLDDNNGCHYLYIMNLNNFGLHAGRHFADLLIRLGWKTDEVKDYSEANREWEERYGTLSTFKDCEMLMEIRLSKS